MFKKSINFYKGVSLIRGQWFKCFAPPKAQKTLICHFAETLLNLTIVLCAKLLYFFFLLAKVVCREGVMSAGGCG